MSEAEDYGGEATEGGYESAETETPETGETPLTGDASIPEGEIPLGEAAEETASTAEVTEEKATGGKPTAEASTEEVNEEENGYYTSYKERLDHTPSTDSELGSWEGERGESKFYPNEETEDGAAAKAKLAEYGMDGIEYNNAEPDFSRCCEAEVKIDNMTAERDNYKNADGETQMGNFYQADEKCAELWNQQARDGRKDWTATDVRDWRRDEAHKCSWHECCDTSTMQLVPTEIHSLHKHSGGVAECKKRDNIVETGDEFDE